MNATIEEKLAEYWLMPADELRNRIDLLTRISELRAQATNTSFVPMALHSSAPPPVSSRGLPQRQPMRAPKAGSLRADIQSVLRGHGKPMTRADIIDCVAKTRGVTLTAKFRAKVGDTLVNPHDPLFTRVAHGVYGLQEEA